MLWPRLGEGADLWPTTNTLQLWSQVVGKIRLMLTPWINHGWHVTLYVSARGLTTGLINVGARGFEIEFDLVASKLYFRDVNGPERWISLGRGSVSSFYNATITAVRGLGFDVEILGMPCEIEDARPFEEDDEPRPYEPAVARNYWRALVCVQGVLQRFRSQFIGKCSPIHFFWGGFDLAVTRFSGRPAPPHPGGMLHVPNAVAREAYSQEVSSAGFWPGGGAISAPAFYSYAYPTPAGFALASVKPEGAYFDSSLGEFLLPYEVVAGADDPEGMLMEFLQSTYEAAADHALWDRARLEGPVGPLGRPPQSGDS